MGVAKIFILRFEKLKMGPWMMRIKDDDSEIGIGGDAI